MLTKQLSEKISYEPMSGCWLWIGAWDRHGYGVCKINKHNVLAHRAVWSTIIGAIPTGYELDHKCHTPACCNPDHMRIATHAENLRNQRKNTNNKSGYKGVSWCKKLSKWQASIKFNGKSKHLGFFDSTQEAHEAYMAESRVRFGSFANSQ